MRLSDGCRTTRGILFRITAALTGISGTMEDPLLTRRSFLAGLAVAAVALTLDPYRYVTTHANAYGNARLGLSLNLPAGWIFSSVADFVALRERQELLDELPDELHPLKDPENLPVFVFEDPRPQRAQCNPGIILFDEPADPVPADPRAGHLWMLNGFAQSYRDLVVDQDPHDIDLFGASGTVSHWQYTHDLSGRSVRRIVRTLLVFRGQRAQTFHMSDNALSPASDDKVWHRFLESVRYER